MRVRAYVYVGRTRTYVPVRVHSQVMAVHTHVTGVRAWMDVCTDACAWMHARVDAYTGICVDAGGCARMRV